MSAPNFSKVIDPNWDLWTYIILLEKNEQNMEFWLVIFILFSPSIQVLSLFLSSSVFCNIFKHKFPCSHFHSQSHILSNWFQRLWDPINKHHIFFSCMIYLVKHVNFFSSWNPTKRTGTFQKFFCPPWVQPGFQYFIATKIFTHINLVSG